MRSGKAAPLHPALRSQTILQMGGLATVKQGAEVQLYRIASSTLSGGFQSRMYKAVREKLGAAYGVQGGIYRLDTDGRHLFSVKAAVDHDRAVAAMAAMREEYALWWEKGITQDEMDDVRGRMRTGRAEAMRNPAGIAGTLINGLSLGRPDDMIAMDEAQLARITVAEVNAFIRVNLPRPPLAFVIVGPENAAFKVDCVIKAVEEADRCRQ